MLEMYTDVSLQVARDDRDDARRLLADGIDPGQKRRDERITQHQSSNTFGAIGREWLDKLGPNWSTRHRERVTRQVEADLFPWIGDMAPDDIDAPLLLA